MEITNSQNARHDSLRSYQIAYADYEQRLINSKTNKANHVKTYEPTVILSDRSIVFFLAEYFIIGFILLIIVLLFMYTVYYLFDDRIQDIKYLREGRVPIYEYNTNSAIDDNNILLQLINTRHLANNFNHFLYRELEDTLISKDNQERLHQLMASSEELSNTTLQFITGFDISVAKKLVESDCCIIGIQKKKNTYGDLDRLIIEAKDFGVPIIGILFLSN